MTFRAKYPSAGLPIANDFAIVSGLTGRIAKSLASYADIIGEHPSAWPINIFVLGVSIRPAVANSFIPFQILVKREPEAPGTIQLSGAFHPSCSETSKPNVLLPSE